MLHGQMLVVRTYALSSGIPTIRTISVMVTADRGPTNCQNFQLMYAIETCFDRRIKPYDASEQDGIEHVF